MQVRDLTGQTFGRLKVIKRAPNDSRPGVNWECLCKCGNKHIAKGIDLTCGKVKSCGCLQKERLDNLVGKRFGRWTVIKRGPNNKYGLTHWHVRCDCGTRAIRSAGALKSGASKSCGCYQDEMRSQNSTKHGQSRSLTYSCWRGMRSRCNNPNADDFEYYGGRGIIVCKRWDRFENFLEDMGECSPGMTIERKNTNGNYEPNNCIWDSRKAQSRNRRDTILLTHNGQTKPLATWAEELGLKSITIHMRLRRGDTHSEALRPVN